ncbi:MAG: hypothetical protein CBD62_00315 [Candidatus Pelagibacter sp. TMED202]|nr:MAG: hypothetical protein CBD62_00315 [Candidatus Pelagibacter sp. TMED202]|tara:strand:- start:2307 stop:2561 length:255 start_codon:yes stop_codon:yes gene_type:complete
MKIFFYKTILVAFVFFIAFKITIGSLINQAESKVKDFTSKENVEIIKSKIRKEMQNAIEKDDYIKEEDAIIIRGFINKIKSELN